MSRFEHLKCMVSILDFHGDFKQHVLNCLRVVGMDKTLDLLLKVGWIESHFKDRLGCDTHIILQRAYLPLIVNYHVFLLIIHT